MEKLNSILGKILKRFNSGATALLARNSAEVEARAGREGKGVWGKGIPAPPERNFSEISIWIFFEKSSDFVQDRQPKNKKCENDALFVFDKFS